MENKLEWYKKLSEKLQKISRGELKVTDYYFEIQEKIKKLIQQPELDVRYVWLNMNTGEFSNSWGEKEMKYLSEDEVKDANTKGWKLIKYKCVNDESFELYNQMKLR